MTAPGVPLVVLACDSGSRSAGFAVTVGGVPQYASAVGMSGQFHQVDYLRLQLELTRAAGYTPGLTVIEYPRVWGRYYGGRKIDANALIRVALGAGIIGGLCRAHGIAAPVFVLPGEWTGKIPKLDRHATIREDLGADVVNALVYPTPPSLQEHALDALGLALWAHNVGMDQ